MTMRVAHDRPPAPAPASRQGARRLRGRRRAAAARRDRSRQRVRRRHERAGAAQGRGAHAAHGVVARQLERDVPHHMLARRRRRDRRARCRRSRRTATRSRAARCSAAAPRCSRSSASCAATSRLGVEGVHARAARSPASRCPPGSSRATGFDPPLFSPATKAETGHDENITIARDAPRSSAPRRARELERLSRLVYERGRDIAAAARDHHRRHQVRVRPRRDGQIMLDRRSADARQLALLAGGRVRSRAGRSRASTSSRCATISTASAAPGAGTATRRRRRCRPRSSTRRARATSMRSGASPGTTLDLAEHRMNFAREGLVFIVIAALHRRRRVRRRAHAALVAALAARVRAHARRALGRVFLPRSRAHRRARRRARHRAGRRQGRA